MIIPYYCEYEDEDPSYNELQDCQRILNIFLINGCNATLKQSYCLWRYYSSNYWAASWLQLPDDEEELYIILRSLIK
jgi:hypothetical protein